MFWSTVTAASVISSSLMLALLPLLGSAVAYGVLKCDPNCARCHLQDWDLQWVCYECDEGYTIWRDQCVPPCTTGFYRFGGECKACVDHCDECTGPLEFECTKCSGGYVLDERRLCLTVCLDGEFPLADGSGCAPCHSSCLTCVDSYEIHCTSCLAPNTLVPHVTDATRASTQSSTGMCVAPCPEQNSTFRKTTYYRFCKDCPEHCVRCQSPYTCDECAEGYTLITGRCQLYKDTSEDSRFDDYFGDADDRFADWRPDFNFTKDLWEKMWEEWQNGSWPGGNPFG